MMNNITKVFSRFILQVRQIRSKRDQKVKTK